MRYGFKESGVSQVLVLMGSKETNQAAQSPMPEISAGHSQLTGSAMHYKDAAYLLGGNAFLGGFSLTDNPFDKRLSPWREWRLGWLAAQGYSKRYFA